MLTAQACASSPPPEPVAVAEPRVVVRVLKDTPPADLLACPVVPVITVEPGGQLPREKRVEIYGLASAYRENTQRLLRLIGWHAPGTCGTPAAEPAQASPLSPPA